MLKDCEDIILKLLEIAKKYNTLKSYEDVILECNRKLMSKGVSLYGMFYPDKELNKYFTYKGKISYDEKSKDFEYFFDELERLRITKRYSNDKLLNIIYYNYTNNYIEIYWLDFEQNTLITIGYIEYSDGKLVRFVESGNDDIINLLENKEKIKSYFEYNFNDDNDYLVKRVFSAKMYSDGRNYEKTIKTPKIYN